jgi:hypothetical protein
MIITKNDLLTIKGENNINKFLRSKVNVGIYFKYLWDDKMPNIDRDRMFLTVELPTVNRMFV